MKLPNKNVTLIKYASREEWLAGRHNGVGASDVSTLFDLNSFTNKTELFWNKIRLTPSTPHNINSVSGEIMEPIIAKYFSHFDELNPSDEVLVSNIDKGIKLRKIQRFSRNVRMNDLPLSCTLDYVAPKLMAAVEMKNMLSYVVNRYESQVMPGHILQAQAQMMVTGLTHAYLCYFVDGRFYREYHFDANYTLHESIREQVNIFWEKVKAGRSIWNDPTLTEQEKMIQIYDNELEPEISNAAQESLSKFMNTRALERLSSGKIMATDAINELLGGYKKYREIETGASNEKEMFGNKLKSLLIANGCDEITSPDSRTIASFRANSRGGMVLKVN